MLEYPKGKAHLGDLGVDKRMILKLILKRQGANWIELAQGVVHYEDFVTMDHSVL
jgi:hypothetical protein